MAKRSDVDVGQKHSCDCQNDGEMFPGKLPHSGLPDPIRMDFFATNDKYMGYTFVGVKKLLQETFLPFIFFGKYKSLSLIVETMSMIPFKKSVLGLQDPETSSNKNT